MLGFIPVVNNIFIAASSEEERGMRKCNSEGCLPFPCTLSALTIELLQGITRSSPANVLNPARRNKPNDLHRLLQTRVLI